MLTSYCYLLGGCTAAFFATSILHLTTIPFQSLLANSSEPALIEAVDVSYRGSGRLGNSPNESTESRRDLLASHRGSGRVQPGTS